MHFSPLLLASLAVTTLALNFDWEEAQLSEAETEGYAAIRFGSLTQAPPLKECKSKFNETLGGVLLRPAPLAIICYSGPLYNAAGCETLKVGWGNANLHSYDPTNIMSQWASGSSCVPTNNPNSTCTQGGYPVYVVNATTIRHIQLTVNFARNNNIRLVIKNSGHDFNGKSIGGHSLSIWTHHLKSLTYHPAYTTSDYSGRAVALGAGVQAFDGSALMNRHNMTFIIAGGATVGLAGGFFQGGGHSSYTSYYGLGADQVIRINAVTADGRLVTADAEENRDLYWAFRGGGAGTYGIVTSIVVKAFPRTPSSSGSITFSTVPIRGSPTGNLSVETFWQGVKAYWDYCIAICDQGGLGYNFIRHTPNPSSNTTGLTFTTSIYLPNRSASEYRTFARPLLQTLNRLGIPISLPQLSVRESHNALPPQHEPPPLVRARARARTRTDDDDTAGNTLIASRFFLRANHDSPPALQQMHLAIRAFVERGGYTFHGINYAPTLAVSGNPDNAVHPAFRSAIMHAEGYDADAWWDGRARVGSVEERVRRHDRLQAWMQTWRDITPGSGSYMNEGDAQEKEWKDAFYGSNYERLAGVKRAWDPEGVFWAVGAVGSDGWEIRGGSGGGREGLVTQDGRLCRV